MKISVSLSLKTCSAFLDCQRSDYSMAALTYQCRYGVCLSTTPASVIAWTNLTQVIESLAAGKDNRVATTFSEDSEDSQYKLISERHTFLQDDRGRILILKLPCSSNISWCVQFPLRIAMLSRTTLAKCSSRIKHGYYEQSTVGPKHPNNAPHWTLVTKELAGKFDPRSRQQDWRNVF